MSVSSLRLSGLATLGAAFLTAAGTSAAQAPRAMEVKRSSLTSSTTTARFCATRPVTGAGVVRKRYIARADGFLTARLAGGDANGDWDLAIVDARTRKALDGSAGLASREIATTAVLKGQVLRIQACRHEGAARSVGLSTQLTKLNFTKLAKRLKGQKVVLVRVKLNGAADAEKLRGLGLDLADHGARDHWDAQLYSDAQQARLRESGLEFTVREGDVLAQARRDRARERRAARRPGARRILQRPSADTPTGRTSYRTVPEFQEELRALAERNPDIVKLVRLPRRTVEGREILGIEIAERVQDPPDGRPTFVNLGAHHAREWPSAEAPMEWAYDLIRSYRDNGADDQRWATVVRNARTVVIPIVNVDGYAATIASERNNLSITNPGEGGGFEQAFAIGAYKRKNCSTGDPVTERLPCILRTRQAAGPGEPIPPFGEDALAYRDLGVDLNRNYGEQWGGPGTEHFRLGTWDEAPEDFFFGTTYHGPGPFSEPEVEAVRQFTRGLNVSMLIGNHTYTGLILRPPGTSEDGPAPDETRLQVLGDAMAIETDYISQYGYQLYDTTGTLDDYIYTGLGAFAYTPEIGKENFHPDYVTGFKPEYYGRPREDPDTGAEVGQLGGLREAYLLAAEAAIDPGSHSVLRGTAPPGRTLRLSRSVVSQPSLRPDDNGVNDGPDTPIIEPRTLTMTVPASGEFEWHIPPSRQPGKTLGPAAAPWTLTCEDGGTVRETRAVRVERSQAVAIGLSCGQAPAETCTKPRGFSSVRVARSGRGLRLSFTKLTGNPVTVDIFRTSRGRKVVNAKRVARFRNLQRGFTWNGRKTGGSKRRVARGVFYVRFRVTDEANKVDARRIVVAKRKNGRFYKRGKFRLESTCR